MNRNDIVIRIIEIIDDLRRHELVKDSFNWYVNNYLKLLLEKLKQNANPEELKLSAKKFIMFCTDSMDWDDPKYQEYTKLGEMIYNFAR